MIKIVLVILLAGLGFLYVMVSQGQNPFGMVSPESSSNPVAQVVEKFTSSPAPKVSLQTPAESKVLNNNYHVFQSYNNCGPAAMSMALSYYGITRSQQQLGQELRPYQVPGGDNDDKSVTLEEIAEKSKEFGLVPYLRPNGDLDLIKLFITYDIPVITRTWLKVDDDIGHYRVVKGYNGNTIVQDDSLQGKNLSYSESEFDAIWKKFGYEYLVLVPEDKVEIAEAIIGEDVDEKVAWTKAVKATEAVLAQNPDDIDARFNLSVELYKVGDYQRSVEEFEKVEGRLPFRTLWYQIEPVLSYMELKDYPRVMEISDRILNNHNRAFSELYILRGKIYQEQGNVEAARAEYEKAVMYNSSLKSAREALDSL